MGKTVTVHGVEVELQAQRRPGGWSARWLVWRNEDGNRSSTPFSDRRVFPTREEAEAHALKLATASLTQGPRSN